MIDNCAITTVWVPKGRGTQMNAGAKLATGDVLLFLHADTQLPDGWFDEIQHILSAEIKQKPIGAGAFDVTFDNQSILFKILGKLTSLRSKTTRVPYGDQGLFFLNDAYNRTL